MTICIGALCADAQGRPGRYAVVASDRMVTMGGITEFEHDVPKMTAVTDRIVALMAGDAVNGASLIRALPANIAGSPPTVRRVAESAAGLYAQHRRQVIEAAVLGARGVTLQDFYGGGVQLKWQPQLVAATDHTISNFDFGIELLVAGVDADGAELYHVGNPGGATGYLGQIGYGAIGSGTLHALQAMIGVGHTPSRALAQTIFSVYASKRQAEIAPGVGEKTDMWVIRDSGTSKLDQAALEHLASLYEDYRVKTARELEDRMKSLKLPEEGNGSAGQPEPDAAKPTEPASA